MSESELFEKLLKMPIGERQAWIDQRCVDNPALRQRFEEMLAIDRLINATMTFDGKIHSIRPSQLPQIVLDEFEIEERLGAGAMGVVYRARQLSIDRLVALKVLGGAVQSEGGRERFRREATSIAKLKHPNIATVYFVGQDEQCCYLAMQFVNGITLREMMRRVKHNKEAESIHEAVWGNGPHTLQRKPTITRFDEVTASMPTHQPSNSHTSTDSISDIGSIDKSTLATSHLGNSSDYVNCCANIVRQAANALAYAHAQGIIHRDVKPDNLLVDSKWNVTLIDFGLARSYDDETVTYTGQLVGTPLYMSPEQIVGENTVDQRTDIYSLGIVFYELLALSAPHEATNRENLFREILLRSVLPLSWRNECVSDALSSIVHHAIDKTASERYQSMNELIDDIDRYTLGQAVQAPRYRYILDLAQIRAERPEWITVIGSISCMCSIGYIGYIVTPIVLNSPWRESSYSTTILFATLLFAFSFGILSGFLVAYWFGIVFGLTLVGLGTYRIIFPFVDPQRETDPFIWLSFGLMILIALAPKGSRKWFGFANELRKRFRNARKSVLAK